MRIFAPLVALALCACAGETEVIDDAAVHDGQRADAAADAAFLSCADQGLPTGDAVANGFMVLGAGRDAFEPMPSGLQLEYGFQGGFDVVANIRMEGFVLGNSRDILDPTNPRTYLRASFADSNIPVGGACFRVAYKPSPLGGYELVTGIAIVFNTCWRSDQLIGKRLRIDAYLSNPVEGTAFAHDAKVVTLLAPPDGTYPVDQGSPPCQDGPVDPPPVTPLAMPPVPEIRWAP